MPANFSRLLPWLIVSIVLAILAQFLQASSPGNVLAVSVYKAHLLSLGGWVGYWLDRALFPYDRPHTYLEEPEEVPLSDFSVAHDHGSPLDWTQPFAVAEAIAPAYGYAMLRRAIIVAAALICVGLGA
ncbi:putative holin [Variovorax boronicumulans]